ncbi:MAG: tRNA lysidine(34) synthetase TilS [Rickettsiales bacterium]|nr:tRNA lysidine(34) synthetase TilS [Rickettsiales bacterium]
MNHISRDEFTSIMNSKFIFENSPHIGLSISGGPDSMALLMLVRDWIKIKSGKITVFHFDHKMRKKSSQEAKWLNTYISKFGIKCHLLAWERDKKLTINMHNAREARYKKIIEISKKLKIIHLMTAHHSNDNLETYFMRKKRNSFSLGLSSIPRILIKENLQILRPLLGFSKQRLISTCNFFNVKWIEDSNNFNLQYERPRVREELGKKTANQILKLEEQFKKTKNQNEEMEKKIRNFFIKNLNFFEYGVFQIDKNKFLQCDKKLKVQILKKILTTASGKIFSPRESSVQNLIKLMKLNYCFKYTLHSCLLIINSEKISVFREISSIKEEKKIILKGNPYLWDNRFFLYSKNFKLECERITNKNWVFLKKYFAFKKNCLNFFILSSLPLIKINRKLFIPFLSLSSEDYDFYFKPVIPITRKNFF